MRKLTSTLFLTIAVHLGSVGVSAGASFDCKMDKVGFWQTESVKIIYASSDIRRNKMFYLSVVDDSGKPIGLNPLIIPILSVGQIILGRSVHTFYINKFASEGNLVGHYQDPHDFTKLISVVVKSGETRHLNPIRIFVPTPSGSTHTGNCEVHY
tara:strand:- start:423 stop:884 length:462 start_codon:yes stop_codon:yes gene_type:complete